jgi:predicted RNase H-like HicB family nuclease
MKKEQIAFRIQVIVEPDEGEYHAYCPALKGLHTGGTTQEEAYNNAIDAAIAYIETLIEDGNPIPVGVIAEGNGTKNIIITTEKDRISLAATR